MRKSDPDGDALDVAVGGGQGTQDAGTGLKQEHEQVAFRVQANLARNTVFLDQRWRQRRETLVDGRIRSRIALTEFRVQTEDGQVELAADP